MRVFIDLDTSQLVLAPGVSAEVTQLGFKRAAQAVLEVQFVRGANVVELPGDAEGVFGVKVTGEYDSDYVTASLGWIKTGAGDETVYTFVFTWETTPIDMLFNVDGDSSNDEAQLSFMGEVQWSTGGKVFKTPTLTVTVDNDVNRGDESPPDVPPIRFGIYFHSEIVAIGSGVDFIAVVFPEAFPAGLAVNVVATVMKSGAAKDNLFATVRGDSISETGFTVDLSAATGDATYKLNYMATAI